MARNGSGVYSVPNTFTPSTTISSSAVNSNFSDAGSELTNSLAADGQTTMTGAIKGANGSASAPSYGFASDTNTGVFRKGADQLGFATAGTERAYFDNDGVLVFAVGATVGGNPVDAFPSGTVMLFKQTSAPTGWTKDTSNNNNSAVRIVTGSASTGGTVDFSTAFASQTPSGTVGGTAITEAQMPAHTHGVGVPTSGGDGGNQTMRLSSAQSGTLNLTSGSTGSGQTHTHSFTGNAINLAVKYTDVIQATKD